MKRAIRLSLLALVVACGGEEPAGGYQPTPTPTPTPTATPTPAPTILDYLISNVCADAQDRPTTDDPATCERQRDIREGETLPYRLFDQGRYQETASIPEPGNRVRIIKRLAHYDGYDLIEHDASEARFIETSDPGCGVQRITGWLIAPMTPGAGQVRHNMRIQRVTPSEQCPAVSEVIDHSIETVWTAPEPYTFETGKELLTLWSEHRAHFDLSRVDNAIERFGWTREYGLSRWEAWVPEKRCSEIRCDTDALVGRCKAGSESWGGQRWLMIDCRDQTLHTQRGT